MIDLTVINQNGQLLVDSKEVAEMIGKRHDHLLRDIDGYAEVLEKSNVPKIGVVDFFISDTYNDAKGEQRPCYLITRKGCDMVANKMTGEKGVLFTAAYVTKFEEMEQAQKPKCIEDLIIMQAQTLKDMRLQVEQASTKAIEAENKAVEVKQEVQAIRDVIVLNPNSWRTEANSLLNKMAKARGGSSEAYMEVREESYKLFEQRAGVKLEIRLVNRKRKVLEETGSRSKANKVTKIDVIADDKRLTEVYIAIVKDMAIKYKVG